jgi:DNA-binding GntR family transcriptional regulator
MRNWMASRIHTEQDSPGRGAQRLRAHETLTEVLRQRIADGTYPPGSVFPAVSVVGATFGFSTSTARLARRALVREGLLESPRGDILTFVCEGPGQAVPNYKEELATTLRRRIQEGVYPPDTQIPSTHDLARELRVGPTAMRCAVNQLSEEGHLETRGCRTFVTAQDPPAAPATG